MVDGVVVIVKNDNARSCNLLLHADEQIFDCDSEPLCHPHQRHKRHVDLAALDLLPMLPVDERPFGRSLKRQIPFLSKRS